MFFPRLVFASIVIASCLTTSTLGATATLAKAEVEALRIIGSKLRKTNWNFDIDPCGGDESRLETVEVGSYYNYYENNVTCDCSFNNNTSCHVVSIRLKAQNLSGTLPPELVRLPFLQEINLDRNYLSGIIPPQWGSMQLINISLLGNRLTGPIPEELAKLSNLTNLVLEANAFSGNLPPALGSLPNIETMLLNSNNFTGELPETFANLTTLKWFRISDNNFTGKIPEFIFRNWTKLEQIYIEASGLSGPIPTIASSENLTRVIISDLNGAETKFPQLSNLPNLERLILRSCNLIGELPVSLGALTTLSTLDLSFNSLSGEIPDNLSALSYVDQFFLNGNNFTGAIPRWILETQRDVDISYNNFTGPRGLDCSPKDGLNSFASVPRTNNTGIFPCLESEVSCPEEPLHFLYINCGGREEIDDNGTTYEADIQKVGPSTSYRNSESYWAISSTGVFLGDDRPENILTVVENQKLSTSGSAIYANARLSPSTLTYYAFCLKNATYTVILHFSEIQFTNGQNYGSLGRRIFDVYIQGKQELKDFNIMEEAHGAGKPTVRNFPAVNVTDGTLEIRLRWAGKGTTNIPVTGTYGPLISAISIFDPAYKPPAKSEGGISTSVVIIIMAATAFATFLILGILRWYGCLRRKSTLERDLKGLELQTTSFSLRQIKAATNNFDAANKIGEGGFGPVYKGILADGTVIAVKQLSARSKQGNREFVNEIGLISALQHPHLVKLYGCCIEGNQLMLIYEYLENNCLARALFGPEEFQLNLDWPTRRKICIGIARGLTYLHEESRLKVVHRDIKATNVLLDKNLNPKISDFGLAKLAEGDNTHMSTRVAGTYGYMAPEYAMHGRLSDKADVYSFGIVALEIVNGRCNTNVWPMEDSFYLLDWARSLKEQGSLLDLVDPRIRSDCNIEEVMVMIDVALLCTNPTAAARPSMSSVVSTLEGGTAVLELIKDSSVSANAEAMKKLYQQMEEKDSSVSANAEAMKKKYQQMEEKDSSVSANAEAMKKLYQQMEEKDSSVSANAETMKKLYQQMEENDAENSQTKSMLGDGPWSTSSTSTANLYPASLTSTYW